jgi:hypothetical protein
MNFFRGLLSVGIIAGCILNWFEFETDFGVFALNGLNWVPVRILLYASIITTGYGFYNSYRGTNENSGIYLINGLYGAGLSVYIYLTVVGNLESINLLADYFAPEDFALQDYYSLNNGVGLFATGLFSLILFFTGFDKAESKERWKSTPDASMKQQHSNEKENTIILEWLKANPGKSINDYYSNS